MPKTIRNKFDEKLTYDSLMKAHIEQKREKDIGKKLFYLT